MDFYSKYFTIKNVYYTDETILGGIRKTKLRELIDDPNKHHSGYYRYISKTVDVKIVDVKTFDVKTVNVKIIDVKTVNVKTVNVK
jgi:hypothetical protein